MASVSGVKAFKSGIWYTAANFITKSIGFLTTPIFARLLSHSEYGLYSNYISWTNTFVIFATLNLGTTFISARFDFEDCFDEYISSVLALSSLVTVISAVLINIFSGFVTSITGISRTYLNIMFVYLVFYSAVEMFQIKERYYYEYKKSVFVSLGIAFSTAALSVLFVRTLEDKLAGRIIGSALPTVLVGAFLYFSLMYRGRKILTGYWKYALPTCLPFIPHILSLSLLSHMDKMMITNICGPEDNALYSIAYSCGAVITLLITSINTAFSPWLGEKLKNRQYEKIYSVSGKYVLLFVFAACGIMLITPEILLIMGGNSYQEAIYVMPPVSFGCICQYIYSMYVSVEQFSKKTVGMAFASSAAALSNYILNSIFIPRYGYIAAAYTTLASYMLLLLLHIVMVRNLRLGKIYPLKTILLVLLFMSVYTVGINCLYSSTIVRYVCVGLYAVLLITLGIKNKRQVLALLGKRV